MTGQASLTKLIAAHPAGSTLTLTITRDGQSQQVQVGTRQSGGHPVMGVEIQEQYKFPFQVKISVGDIGGPSAGMMFALGIIDKLTKLNLTAGRFIAGTGEIERQRAGRAHRRHPAEDDRRAQRRRHHLPDPRGNCADTKGAVPSGHAPGQGEHPEPGRHLPGSPQIRPVRTPSPPADAPGGRDGTRQARSANRFASVKVADAVALAGHEVHVCRYREARTLLRWLGPGTCAGCGCSTWRAATGTGRARTRKRGARAVALDLARAKLSRGRQLSEPARAHRGRRAPAAVRRRQLRPGDVDLRDRALRRRREGARRDGPGARPRRRAGHVGRCADAGRSLAEPLPRALRALPRQADLLPPGADQPCSPRAGST